jgi:hypothetical protein
MKQRAERGQGLAEAAITLPVLLLVSLGLITLGLVAFAAVHASNAANYGARMGSTAQENPAGVAAAHAQSKVNVAPLGSYAVSVSGGGAPGTLVSVTVRYEVPNYFAGLAGFFGVTASDTFSGSAVSYFRKEGW